MQDYFQGKMYSLCITIFLFVVALSSCLPPPDFDEPDPIVNPSGEPIMPTVLLVSSVFASGDDGNVPENTLDGNLSTRWSSHGLGEWITFELNDTYEINSINISWYVGDRRIWSFDVLYSEDGMSWSSVYSGFSNGTSNNSENFDLIDAAAKYVRILGKGNNNNSWNSITTVSIIGTEVDENTSFLDYTSSPLEPETQVFSLRGNPEFNPNTLSLEQRAHYDAIKQLIANPPSDFNPYATAARDDIWWYGHNLHTHITSVLVVFRVTGDLTLLDHVDELAQIMRSKLYDSWSGTIDAEEGKTDGFLNWRQYTTTNDANRGTDLRIEYDQKTHAVVAQIAYALHKNRDFVSPKGYDYAEHADFWEDYLINHFEAKMRSRHGTTDGSFPIVNWPPTLSSYTDWTKWHYYMGELTGNEKYTAEAIRMSDVIMNQMRTVSTPEGDAYVWTRSNPDHPSGTALYLSPTTYAEYVFLGVVDFHLEGFYEWADSVHVKRLAHTWTEFIMDKPDPIQEGMALDIGGEVERAGIPPAAISSSQTFRRITPHLYSRSSYAFLAIGDSSGRVVSLTNDVIELAERQSWDRIRLHSGQMLSTHMQSDLQNN